MAQVIAEYHPRGGVLAVLPGAAGISRVRAGDDDADRRCGETHCGVVCLGDRTAAGRSWTAGGGSRSRSCDRTAVCSPRPSVVDQPISTVLSGPAAGALGAAVIADRAGFRSVVTCDGGGTSTDVTVITDGQTVADHGGLGRAVPGEDPDDRRRDGRRRRRFGGLDLDGGHAQGRTSVGGRGPGTRLLPAGRQRTDGDRRAPGARPDSRRTCSAARSRWTSRRRPRPSARWPVRSG